MASHSIRVRFAASLLANGIRSGLSFGTGLLLARWMGPTDYGRMAFLLASFVAFRQLLDVSSSTAFFTFLSQRPRSRRFVRLYWSWVAIQFVVSLLLITLILPEHWMANLWKGEARTLVLLAFVAAFMQGTVWSVASQMAEAERQTIRVQRLGSVIVLVHFGIVLSLWLAGELAIPLIFAALAVEWGIGGWLAAQLYKGQHSAAEPTDSDTVASVWREFWAYCLPFIPYAALGFAHDFANRWMLQHWGGAVEQAYYAMAAQFAAVALLATSSILQILWKEIAEAHHRQDKARVEALYRRACRFLYFVGAAVAGALLPWAGELLSITVGPRYVDGTIPLMLMFLFVVHQSIGQISGTMLYATGRTRMQVLVGVFGMASSLIGAYFTMAPPDAAVPGLGLGSKGLAYELALVQIAQVNLQMWLIARVFGWKYEWNYQLVVIALTLAAGGISKTLVMLLSPLPDLTLMLLAAPVYVAIVGTMAWLLPRLAGFERHEILSVLQRVRRGKSAA